MAAAARGVTVTYPQVQNFDTLTPGQADAVLYNQLVPFLEGKGIKLSDYGNHAGGNSLANVQEYDQQKADHRLFDVPKVQRVFAQLAAHLNSKSTYKRGSYGLKHDFEKLPGVGYVANGSLIAAMLLAGYTARFGKRTEAMSVNCEFKVEFV